jgi:hypothetical protein
MVRSAKNLDDAVAQIKLDPARPVRTRVEDLELELRAIAPQPVVSGLGDRMAALGAWEGESTEEILDLPAARD